MLAGIYGYASPKVAVKGLLLEAGRGIVGQQLCQPLQVCTMLWQRWPGESLPTHCPDSCQSSV